MFDTALYLTQKLTQEINKKKKGEETFLFLL
jgi:hypothetical protein